MIQKIIKRLVEKKNLKELSHILEQEDFCKIRNQHPQAIARIIIVIRRMLPYSGGYTSILRLGTQLENQGYHVIYAITSEYQSTRKAREIALTNLSEFRGEIDLLKTLETVENDILIATHWKTVYQVKYLKGYKMYFVQDYEPYFSQYGENFLLAKKTYELGFHMVSLGQWNKYMIENSCVGTYVEYIDFPFERTEYRSVDRDYGAYRDKRTLKIAAFIKDDQKRIPHIVENLLVNLEKEFQSHGYELDIRYFGISTKRVMKNGKNLGVLSKQQLMELYADSDFGVCASMTNVSLVPYEMLATGLPLIEFEDGTFPFFFPRDVAILTDFSYKHLFERIVKVIKNPEQLERQHEIAEGYMKTLSWENTGRQFVGILKSITEE